MTAWILIFISVLTLPVYQDSRLERARQKLREARQALDDSEKALVGTYTFLETEFDKISGPHCPDFLRGLAGIWAAQAPEVEKLWKEIVQPGRRPSEKRFAEAIDDMLTGQATDKTKSPPQLIAPFRDAATEYMYDKLRRDGTYDEADLLGLFNEILTTRTPFFEFWNDHLYRNIPEAADFSRANEDFAEAKLDVDRLLYPTEFDNRGRRAPPGMVFVSGGVYYVGPNTGWERKRIKVKLSDFFIDKYEVTNKEFNIFLNSLPAETRERLTPYFWPKNVNQERYYPEDRADHPVVGVSWEGANAYAIWKGKRLPTEDEWEVAATGGKSLIYPWGKKYNSAICNTRESGFGSTTQVGSFSVGASPLGCFDMSGNAEEWTATDQDGNRVESDSGTIVNVVIRGGSYKSDAQRASALYRWLTPMSPYEGKQPSSRPIGFRCVQEVR